MRVRTALVIGSSRGLGAALVDAFLATRIEAVIGVARSGADRIPQWGAWEATGRYRHVQADLGTPAAPGILADLAGTLRDGPICLVFNAACLRMDVAPDGRLLGEAVAELNRVNVGGLGDLIAAFQEPLLKRGGVFAGISSINAFSPPVLEPRVIYPATKAYLGMALRCLRLAWPGTVRVQAFHLGHIGGRPDAGLLGRILNPSYAATAKFIVGKIVRSRGEEFTWPLAYRLTYGGFFRLLPDRVRLALVRTGARLLEKSGGRPFDA